MPIRANYQYSEAEMRLIKHFAFEDICQNIPPFSMYRMMAEKAFICNEQSAMADSLRLCMVSFETTNRMTPEWDALIAGASS